MRIVQLSDTHISHLGGTPAGNMSLAVDYINSELRPDLVIHTGDVIMLNPDSAEDRDAAWRLHQEINPPFLVVPGNHDVGESGENPWMGISVTSERIAGFSDTWGPDRFLLLGSAANGAPGWAFIGINSERMSSGLPEEAEQWDWLAGAAQQARGRSVMLFLHRPLWFPGGDEPGVTLTGADRQRLLALFPDARLRVVANGHMHRYREAFEGELLCVAAPSLTFAPPAEPEHGLGPAASGVIEYRIDGDAIQARFCSVPGLHGVADPHTMDEFESALAELQAAR
jgi:3',5'-cyclic AMP phosphodiesterase CpdA